MTKEKMERLDTGRAIERDIRQPNSDPVPEAELARFHTCGPPDSQFEQLTELHKKIGSRNYAKLHQQLTGMHVAVPTSTVQAQTPDDWRETTEEMPVSAT